MGIAASTEGLLLLRVLAATGAAVLGAGIALPVKQTSHKVMCALVSFAAGGLFAVTAFHIMPESFELAGFYAAAGATAVGLALFWIVGRYLYFVCPACYASHQESGYLRLGWLMITTMALHSLTDGFAITAGHEAALHHSNKLGLLILLAVSYHKVPEGLALMGVARMSGFSKAKAFIITVLVETTTGLGALIGLLVLGAPPYTLGILLGFIGGSFLYVVLFALLKEMWLHEKTPILFYAGLGMASILAVSWLIGGAAPHG